MKSYILKEYGSWSVLIMSWITGLLTARSYGIEALHILPLLSLILIMNSKQAFSRWIKNRSVTMPLIIFILQLAAATVLLLLQSGTDLLKLLPFLAIPLLYLVLYKLKGEHFIVTEILGFAVLTLAAPIAVFSVTGTFGWIPYIATLTFFTSGVFKVRIFMKKRAKERTGMVLYLVMATGVFFLARIPLLLLLPLLENLYFALFMPKVKLSTVGWTEVLKGIIFLVLSVFLLRI